MQAELRNLRRALLFFLVVSAVVIAVCLGLSKITGDIGAMTKSFGSWLFLMFVAAVCSKRGFIRTALIMEIMTVGIAVSVLALVSSYLAISLAYPLADQQLVAIDQALGFDGAAFIYSVDAHPWLAWLLMNAYASFPVQLFALPVLLVLAGQANRAYALVLAYAMACLAASVISIWFPAVAANVTYGIAPESLQSINAKFGFAFLEEFHALREAESFVFSMERAEGILTFPSVHTSTAVILILCSAGLPYLRYPFLLLNIAMIVSTLTHGGHYLADVIAGIVLAVAAMAITTVIARARPSGSLVTATTSMAR